MSNLEAGKLGPLVADSLWGACRMESADCEAFGVEAIADMLRRDPFPLAEASYCHDSLEVCLAGDQALVIERQEQVTTRVWRIGVSASGRGEKGVMVPFDTDLAQARGDIFCDIAEPGLRAAATGHARTILAAIEAFRSRAFVLRVSGDANAGLALYHLYILSAGRTHRPMQARALALWQGDELRLFSDKPWPHGELVRLVN